MRRGAKGQWLRGKLSIGKKEVQGLEVPQTVSPTRGDGMAVVQVQPLPFESLWFLVMGEFEFHKFASEFADKTRPL